MTKDADITLLTRFLDEEKYVTALVERFEPRRPDAAAFALESRVVLLRHPSGHPLDVALGGLPFEERAVGRASLWAASAQVSLRTCSAEDLIVHKSFAARDHDWADVKQIIVRQGSKLNVAQIFSDLRPLLELKEEPEIELKLRRLFDVHSE